MQRNLSIDVKRSEREILIRKIIRKISDTKDIDEIKNYIITNIGQILNATRCFIGEHDLDKNEDPVIKNQYLCSPEIKNFNGFIIKNMLVEESTFKEILLCDVEKFLKENNFDENSEMFQILKKYNVKSAFSIPVNYNNNFFGTLVVQYDKAHSFNEEDIYFARTIADHLGIAINQANLYFSLEKTMKIEKLLRNLIATVRSTLELNEMLTIICDEIGKAFNVERCSIIQFMDPNDYTKWEVKREYKVFDEIKTIKQINMYKEVGLFWGNIFFNEGRSYFIENIPKINLPEPLKSSYEKLELKTLLGIPIKKDIDKWGGLFLSNIKNNKKWTDDEIKLLEDISDQIYIAIKQAELYEITKKQAEREALLRRITETVRSSLDINEVINKLVIEVGEAFKADRCFIRLFNYPELSDNYKCSESLSSSEVKSSINYVYTEDFNKFTSSRFLNNNLTIFPDTELIINDLDIIDDYKNYIKNMEIKSNYGIPIFIKGKFIGVVALHYTKEKNELSNSDIKLLQMVASQAGIAINQAELYERAQKAAEREKLIRETILSLLSSVSSLNIKEVFKAIVTEIGKLFDADRCFFTEYNFDKDEMFPQDAYKEYVANKTIKPSSSRPNKKEELSDFIKIIIHQKQVVKVENTAEVNFPESTKILLKELSIKSFVGLPVIYGEIPLGVLVLHYVKDYKKFEQDEINTLQTIATQSGIIINQAKLYKKVQETAEKEKMLAEIMAVIKSNLKIDEIFLIICSLLTSFYGVNRIIISKLDVEENKLNILKECCKKNNNDYKTSLKSKEYFYEKIIKNKNLIINDVEEADNPKYFLKDLKLKNIKALMMVPIYINENETGAIIIQDNKKNNWEQKDINFLSRIADYISIAIKESNLYNQSEFISNVSHELKTPLSIINGYTSALLNLEKPDCGTTNKFLHIIKNNSERLNKLIDNLLFISNIENKLDYKNIVFEKLKVIDLIENSIQLCNEKIKSKNIKIEKNIENIVIKKANIILLQQLIINLITNAVNYSESDSIVKLSVVKKDKETLISVEDKGCGIKKEHIPNIFERFYRVDKSRNRETGGTGLGLNISKLIAEIHNGYIIVESVFGKGSTFTLHLPE